MYNMDTKQKFNGESIATGISIIKNQHPDTPVFNNLLSNLQTNKAALLNDGIINLSKVTFQIRKGFDPLRAKTYEPEIIQYFSD